VIAWDRALELLHEAQKTCGAETSADIRAFLVVNRNEVTRERELADVLGEDVPWRQLLSMVRDLKKREDRKVQVEKIVALLHGMDVLDAALHTIAVQVNDETIYEHLRTCADSVDDEETKQKLRDLAEVFAYEFCKTGGTCG
jgi:hypothetical protein